MGALFTTDALWFTIPALVGTLFFAIRLAMAILGIDFVDGAEGGEGGDAFDTGGGDPGVDDVGIDAAHSVEEGLDHAETASVFKFVSIQTVTAFAMGFGWGGLLGLRTLNLSIAESFGVAVLVGIGFAWLIIWAFKLMYAMESSGNLSVRDAMGCEGVTTSTIPASDAGTGRVRLTLRDRQRAFGARTEGDEITMGTHDRVVRVNNDNTVHVTRVGPST